jgi:TonB family protein
MFLTSLQGEMERSRRREAFWMSVLVHLVALVAFVNGGKLFPSNGGGVVPREPEVLQTRDYTFLVLPPDLQKNVPRPHANILSDKNRIARAQEPVIDRRTLQHLLASSSKGSATSKAHFVQRKGLLAQKSAGPAHQEPTQAASDTPPMKIRAGQPEMLSVPAPSVQTPPPVALQTNTEAATGTPSGKADSNGEGTAAQGLNAGKTEVTSHSNVDVLSDTMGVDFGPYLSRILHEVRTNWFNRIPESARAPLMKRGKVSIQFDILKTGQIAAMEVVGTSGDPSLDGAAIGGINQSGPFPPLPPQFQGQYLALRFHFFYNPDTKDLR